MAHEEEARRERAPPIALAGGLTRRRRTFDDQTSMGQRRRKSWGATMRHATAAEATAARRAKRMVDLSPTTAGLGGRFKLKAALLVSKSWRQKHVASIVALDVGLPTMSATGQSAVRLLTARVCGADGVLTDELGEVNPCAVCAAIYTCSAIT